MLSIACRSTGEEVTDARLSAYIGAPQLMPLVYTPSPEAVKLSSSSSTNKTYKNGDRVPPCRTPCLSTKEEERVLFHRTQLLEVVYQVLIRCQRYPVTPFWCNFTRRPACQTVSIAFHQGTQHRPCCLLHGWRRLLFVVPRQYESSCGLL